MKKFFTLLAGFAMAFSGFAQDDLPGAVTYTAKKGSTPTDKTVILTYGEEEPVTVITAEFLDNTSKGSVADQGTWSWTGGNYAMADQNSCEIKFTPEFGGTLEITTAGEIALNKSIWMYVDGDVSNTMDATYGEWTILNGVNLEKQEFNQKIPTNGIVSYQLQKGKTYNFYFAGTKWKLGGFTFIPTDNDDPDLVEEDIKVAAISSGEWEDDDLSFAVAEGFLPETPAEVSYEALADYDVILVSNKVNADSPWADVLRQAVAKKPMVNLSADLIEAWGLGTVTTSESGVITIADENLENPLFSDLAIDGNDLEIFADGVLPVVTPGEYLQNDAVLATVGASGYILQHTSLSGKNTHILIPLQADALTDGEVFQGLIPNALKVAKKSKAKVTAATKPEIVADMQNNITTVSISSKQEGAVIRYTKDGSDPTAESDIFAEPFSFTEPATVKAYVSYLDGFEPSAISTLEVKVSAKADAPVITLTPGEGKATVITISAQEGADIYFSFAGQSDASRTDKTKTEKYTEPITVTEPTTVYAFAIGDDLLQSDLESEKVSIPGVDASNIRLDVESHFYVGNAWISGSSAQYVGMNGDGEFGVSGSHKNAWSHSLDEMEDVKDENGNTVYEEDGVTPKQTYKFNPDVKHEVLGTGDVADWKIVTEGTTFAIEPGTNSPAEITADTKAGYAHAIEMIDVAASNGVLSWKSTAKDPAGNSEKNTGRVESTRAFTAPFDVVTYIKNSNGNGVSTCKLYISKDGNEWTTVKDSEGNDVLLATGPTQRQTARTRVSIEDEGAFYVKVTKNDGSPALHDIYIYTNGELSKQYSGIEDVIATEGAEVIAVEYYNLNGVRIAEPAEGFFIKRATLSNGKVVVEKVVK